MLPPVGSKVAYDGTVYTVTAHGCANMRAGAPSCPHEAEAVTITRRTGWFCVPASGLDVTKRATPPRPPMPLAVSAIPRSRQWEGRRRAMLPEEWDAFVAERGHPPTWRPLHHRGFAYGMLTRPGHAVSLEAILTSPGGDADVERGRFM